MSLIKAPVICYVAAKSGGHLIPALTLAAREKSRDAASRILFISSSCSLDTTIINASSNVDKQLVLPLYVASLQKGFYGLITMIYQIVVSFFKSLFFLWKEKPTKIVSMGGLISVPVCLAGSFLQIPFELWELNAIPGKAVRFLCAFSQMNYICFADCARFINPWASQKTVYPIRFTDQLSADSARAMLGIAPIYKNITLVLGGSQGSSFMNTTIAEYLVQACAQSDTLIIHQTGAHDVAYVRDFYHTKYQPALVVDFVHDLSPYYAAATHVISRAGAGTLFEILYYKKPALLIPLHASTTDHQRDNALAIEREYPELFSVLEQSTLTYQHFADQLKRLGFN